MRSLRTESRLTPPRIVHVVGNLNIGGGQKLTALVATGLNRRGLDVSVISLGKDTEMARSLRKSGIPVISLGVVAGGIGARLYGLASLAGVLRRGRWDIVHTHMFLTSIAATLPARLAGARVFGTSHRIYYPRWQPFVERVLSPFQESIVVDSYAVREILRTQNHIPPAKFSVIYNGIDEAEFEQMPTSADAREALGLERTDRVVGCIAHLDDHKGQKYLVEAMPGILSDCPTAVLLLVGDGPRRLDLEARVQELELGSRVVFLGVRRDLQRVLAALDVLALPSVFEGFGIVQAEAMYTGLPVVATNRGGSTEVVDDGFTGFLVGFGDVASLRARLVTLLLDCQLREQMGGRGRERVERLFLQESMIDNYIRLYFGAESLI